MKNKKKKSKKRGEEDESEATKEMVKLSDIKVSNPLKIDDFRRTTSSLAEAVKVKEGTFAESMRQASRAFNREEIKNMNLTAPS
jgi:hypothetical protein